MMNFLPRAIAANTAPFTFSVAGDYGGNFASGSNLQKVISAIAVKNPAFHIAVGDLGYNDTNPTNWCNSFKANYSKLVLVTGNHDTLNSAGQQVTYTLDHTNAVPTDSLTTEKGAGYLDPATNGGNGYIDACNVPSSVSWIGSGVTYQGGTCYPTLHAPSCYAREYYFDYPTSNPIMRFIFISAGITGSWVDYSVGTPHYIWLKARIDEAKNAGIWVAVVAHKNCITDGTDIGFCASGFDPFNLAISEMGGVDLWINGHEHSYQRSYPITPGACTSLNSVVSCQTNRTSTYNYVRGQGTIVNTVGTGGQGNGGIQNGAQTMFASLCGSSGPTSFGCNNDYGFSQFQVSTQNITCTYISATGTFSDFYVIKVPNPPGDFSVSSEPMVVSRGVQGTPGTLFVNSFGRFGGSGTTINLTATVKGPGNTCSGSNCHAILSPSTVQIASGTFASSSLNVSTPVPVTAPCSYPKFGNSIVTEVYNVTITAAHGSLSHTFTFPLYVYMQPDVNRDGIIDVDDLVLVANFYNHTPSSAWDPNRDLNNDKIIDLTDLSTVAAKYAKSGCA